MGTIRTLCAAMALASLPLSAQTLVTYDGVGAFGEFAGPPDPTVCGYPYGPLGTAFPPGSFGCGPGLLPIPAGSPSMPGGVAYDSVTDSIFVSDGFVVEIYAAGTGLFVDAFTSPLPVTGMGFDSAAGLLWATDGLALVYAMGVPPAPACGAPAPLVFPPFPVPTPAPLSGIDWDPLSGSLWAVDQLGLVHNFLPGGAPGPISAAPYPAVPGPCWPGPGTYPYLRLAVDDASPFGPGHLYLTDGFTVSSILPGGAPAPPTFAFPGPMGAPCFPTAMPTIGLAFAPHVVTYGKGVDPDGLPAPVIGATGATTTPTFGMTITLSGAVSGAPAFLVYSTAPACPACPLFGVLSLLSATSPITILGPFPTSAIGNVTLPIVLPGGLPISLNLYAQWFVVKPLGPSLVQSSDALSLRLALP